MHELKPPQPHRIKELFDSFGFHVSCAAVLDGINPGRILVDDPLSPTSGFLFSPEASYLSGDADNVAFCDSLNEFLSDSGNLGVPTGNLIMIVSSDRWLKTLSEFATEAGIESYNRRHYLCKDESDICEAPSPPGATLNRIDRSFLANKRYRKPDHLEQWIRHNWSSYPSYLRTGFGMATICGNEVAAWSVADCISDGNCEIGIHTASGWRRKGMGAFTAGGALKYAFSRDMKTVGWHCHEENIASRRTAEKVGFHLERNYTEYRITNV